MRAAGPVGLLRRLGAVLYDSLLLLAIWLLVALVFVFVESQLGIALRPVQFIINLLLAWAFFAGFWVRSGQTLGMQTWNIFLTSEGGRRPTPWQATLRYLIALAQWLLVLLGIHLALNLGPLAVATLTAILILGIGVSQMHPQRLMLHDWLSGTSLQQQERPAGKRV